MTIQRMWLTNIPVDKLDEYKKLGLIIGRPHESEKYTVEQLEQMGMVGVYTIVRDSDDNLDEKGDRI